MPGFRNRLFGRFCLSSNAGFYGLSDELPAEPPPAASRPGELALIRPAGFIRPSANVSQYSNARPNAPALQQPQPLDRKECNEKAPSSVPSQSPSSVVSGPSMEGQATRPARPARQTAPSPPQTRPAVQVPPHPQAIPAAKSPPPAPAPLPVQYWASPQSRPRPQAPPPHQLQRPTPAPQQAIEAMPVKSPNLSRPSRPLQNAQEAVLQPRTCVNPDLKAVPGEEWRDMQNLPSDRDYQVIKRLGRGSFGDVLLAKNRSTGQHVALKVAHFTKPGLNEANIRVLQQEGNFLHMLKHDNIVQCFDVYESNARWVFVLEYLRGGALLDELPRLRQIHSAYSEKTVAAIFQQVLLGVAYLHDQNLVHRDIKPDNIVMERAPTSMQDFSRPKMVKLVDFGMILNLNLNDNINTRGIMGTVGYIAPEVIQGWTHTAQMDNYSLGVLLFVMLVGVKPMTSEEARTNAYVRMEPRKLRNMQDPRWRPISRGAKDLVWKLLELDPRKRCTAREALKHRWVAGGAHETVLDAGSVMQGWADDARGGRNHVHMNTKPFDPNIPQGPQPVVPPPRPQHSAPSPMATKHAPQAQQTRKTWPASTNNRPVNNRHWPLQDGSSHASNGQSPGGGGDPTRHGSPAALAPAASIESYASGNDIMRAAQNQVAQNLALKRKAQAEAEAHFKQAQAELQEAEAVAAHTKALTDLNASTVDDGSLMLSMPPEGVHSHGAGVIAAHPDKGGKGGGSSYRTEPPLRIDPSPREGHGGGNMAILQGMPHARLTHTMSSERLSEVTQVVTPHDVSLQAMGASFQSTPRSGPAPGKYQMDLMATMQRLHSKDQPTEYDLNEAFLMINQVGGGGTAYQSAGSAQAAHMSPPRSGRLDVGLEGPPPSLHGLKSQSQSFGAQQRRSERSSRQEAPAEQPLARGKRRSGYPGHREWASRPDDGVEPPQSQGGYPGHRERVSRREAALEPPKSLGGYPGHRERVSRHEAALEPPRSQGGYPGHVNAPLSGYEHQRQAANMAPSAVAAYSGAEAQLRRTSVRQQVQPQSQGGRQGRSAARQSIDSGGEAPTRRAKYDEMARSQSPGPRSMAARAHMLSPQPRGGVLQPSSRGAGGGRVRDRAPSRDDKQSSDGDMEHALRTGSSGRKYSGRAPNVLRARLWS